MKRATMNEAMFEARRFIEACEQMQSIPKNQWTYMEVGIGSKLSAAVKRASMDLTRKLADLRANR